MKYTLLDMTQQILSSMDWEEINSISDNTESMQVATNIRTAFFDILGRLNLPNYMSVVTLNASGDNNKPTLMTIPTTVGKVEWIKYDIQSSSDDSSNFSMITYLPPDAFFDRMHRLNTDMDNVGSFQHTIGTDVFTINYTNDTPPSFYTVLDDNIVLFDSFDSEVDTTLQKSKTYCYGRLVVDFQLTDTFIPPLDDSEFPLLLNEAKALCWTELKQMPNAKAELGARRAWNNLQVNKYRYTGLTDFDALPNFGRR